MRWRGAGAGREALVLGIMSGTSLDGVDCVLVRCRGTESPEYRRHWSRGFPRGLRVRLLRAAAGEAASWECGQLHHDLGRFYAEVVGGGLGREGAELSAVGLHGQTIFHAAGGGRPATWQIGEPAYLAEALGVPVVSNFRAADLAAGGQGAPLATLFHVRAFARRGMHVCVNNLGGISNVTSIDGRGWKGRGKGVGAGAAVLSFDTGPANMLLDLAAVRLGLPRGVDRGGRRAARGRVEEVLVQRWLRHPFFRKSPPKSTGREAFGVPCLGAWWEAMDRVIPVMRGDDRLATLVELTARSIALNYVRHLPAAPDAVILCGGGVRHRHLVARLEAVLRETAPKVEVSTCEDYGWPAEAVEGGAFALLAYERLCGRPGNLPSTTGARHAVWCGSVTEAREIGTGPG